MYLKMFLILKGAPNFGEDNLITEDSHCRFNIIQEVTEITVQDTHKIFLFWKILPDFQGKCILNLTAHKQSNSHHLANILNRMYSKIASKPRSETNGIICSSKFQLLISDHRILFTFSEFHL